MATTTPLGLDPGFYHEPSYTEQELFDILTTYLPEDSSITPEQAANQINDIFPYNRAEQKDGQQSATDFLFEFWEFMFRIGHQLDYQHEPMQRFIALIKALSNLPEIIIRDGGKYDGQSVWQSGLYFSPMLHERYTQIPENKDPIEKYDRLWKNMNGLLAHLTNHNISSGEFYALICISEALEELRRKKPKTPINRRVPAAATWFVLCGPMVYEACKRHECADQANAGDLWKGELRQGFSLQRWEFWRSRFEALSGHLDATEETKEACRNAIEVMDKCAQRTEN